MKKNPLFALEELKPDPAMPIGTSDKQNTDTPLQADPEGKAKTTEIDTGTQSAKEHIVSMENFITDIKDGFAKAIKWLMDKIIALMRSIRSLFQRKKNVELPPAPPAPKAETKEELKEELIEQVKKEAAAPAPTPKAEPVAEPKTEPSKPEQKPTPSEPEPTSKEEPKVDQGPKYQFDRPHDSVKGATQMTKDEAAAVNNLSRMLFIFEERMNDETSNFKELHSEVTRFLSESNEFIQAMYGADERIRAGEKQRLQWPVLTHLEKIQKKLKELAGTHGIAQEDNQISLESIRDVLKKGAHGLAWLIGKIQDLVDVIWRKLTGNKLTREDERQVDNLIYFLKSTSEFIAQTKSVSKGDPLVKSLEDTLDKVAKMIHEYGDKLGAQEDRLRNAAKEAIAKTKEKYSEAGIVSGISTESMKDSMPVNTSDKQNTDTPLQADPDSESKTVELDLDTGTIQEDIVALESFAATKESLQKALQWMTKRIDTLIKQLIQIFRNKQEAPVPQIEKTPSGASEQQIVQAIKSDEKKYASAPEKPAQAAKPSALTPQEVAKLQQLERMITLYREKLSSQSGDALDVSAHGAEILIKDGEELLRVLNNRPGTQTVAYLLNGLKRLVGSAKMSLEEMSEKLAEAHGIVSDAITTVGQLEKAHVMVSDFASKDGIGETAARILDVALQGELNPLGLPATRNPRAVEAFGDSTKVETNVATEAWAGVNEVKELAKKGIEWIVRKITETIQKIQTLYSKVKNAVTADKQVQATIKEDAERLTNLMKNLTQVIQHGEMTSARVAMVSKLIGEAQKLEMSVFRAGKVAGTVQGKFADEFSDALQGLVKAFKPKSAALEAFDTRAGRRNYALEAAADIVDKTNLIIKLVVRVIKDSVSRMDFSPETIEEVKKLSAAEPVEGEQSAETAKQSLVQHLEQLESRFVEMSQSNTPSEERESLLSNFIEVINLLIRLMEKPARPAETAAA